MKSQFKIGEDVFEIVPTLNGVSINGVEVPIGDAAVAVVEDEADLLVKWGSEVIRVHAISPFEAAGGGAGGKDDVRAPMPGTLISLAQQVGANVLAGEEVLVIESMKLQTSIKSPRDGVIASLPFESGQTFNKGDVLLNLEPVIEEGEG